MAATIVPLTLGVDETAIFPQLSTAEELRRFPGSCFCELLPHSDLTAAELFPGHVAVRAGERSAPTWWSDTDSNIAALHLFKLRDIFLFPDSGLVVSGSGEVMRLPMEDAVYVSPDLSALPGIEVRGNATVFHVPDQVERLERSALTMANGAKLNYGHFVLDCLPAASSIRKTGRFDDFPFHFPSLKAWQRQHLALLGIEPVELRGGVYRVDELVYTSGMHHYLHAPNFNYQDVRERQLAAVAPPSQASPKRLYLSRAKYPNRIMVSEGKLRRQLTRLGFTSVDPGSFSVDEQIALFHGAEVIVGSSGATFANVLYCRPDALIVEIQPAGMENQWVRNICLQNRCRFVAYFCDMLAGDPARPERNLRFDLDIDRFVATITGFPPLDTQQPSLGWLDLFRDPISAKRRPR